MKINFLTNEKFKEIIPEPQPAEKLFPEWFAQMDIIRTKKCPFKFRDPKNPFDLEYRRGGDVDNNICGCPGIADYLKFGYIIPAWDNFIFRDYEGSLVVNWTDEYYGSSIGFHGENQYYTMPENSKPIYKHYTKITSPWIIRTSPGVSVMITHPVWHGNDNFTTASGIFHTDASPLNLPWFFKWNYKVNSGVDLETMDASNQVIETGTPIMAVIPFYRNTFTSTVEYVNGSEWNRLGHMQTVLTHSLHRTDLYSKLRKTIGKLFRQCVDMHIKHP